MSLLKKITANQKGQTLVFVLLVMTAALAVGIAISSRTISTIRRTTNIDTASRALAAAEAAVEYHLARTASELDSLAGYPPSGNSPSNVTQCTQVSSTPIRYPGTGTLDSDLQTYAEVIVTRIGCMSNNQSYDVEVSPDKVLELRLDNGTDGVASFDITARNPTALGLHIIELYQQGTQVQWRKRSVNLGSSNAISSDTNITTGASTINYQTANPGGSVRPLLVRILPIKSAPGKTSLTIRNVSSYALPYQGHKITAVGIVGGSQNSVNRTIVAAKSIPALPAIFNFGVYGESGIN